MFNKILLKRKIVKFPREKIQRTNILFNLEVYYLNLVQTKNYAFIRVYRMLYLYSYVKLHYLVQLPLWRLHE